MSEGQFEYKNTNTKIPDSEISLKLNNIDAQKKQSVDLFQIETLTDTEAERVLEKVEIHGDDYQGKYLTSAILKDEKLFPKYKISLGDSVVWFSSSGYDLENGRVAVVAYVEKEGKVMARSYYRSSSQGVWRYLPDYQMSESGKTIQLYGKGYDEQSITLPIILQKALSEITIENKAILTLKRDPLFIFAGTAQKIDKETGDYYREVEVYPKKLEGDFYPEEGKTLPEQIVLTEENSPDFQKLLTSWQQKTGLYGTILVEVFPSKDGKLKFMFCKDTRGRVWVGGIEDDSETQSTGLKKTWIEGGDLVTPAYEYKSRDGDQTYGYGDDEDRNGSYVDMFNNYLKKIPVIQEYFNVRMSPQKNERPISVEQKMAISSSQNFSDLYLAIEQTRGLQGQQKFYEVDELIAIIEQVRNGIIDLQYITNTGGLRDQVKYIMELEEWRKRAAA